MIFPAVADALQWSFLRRVVSWVTQYLDNFIAVGSPESPECQTNLRQCANGWGFQCVGPAAVLVFLGFELDTNQMVIKLLEYKVHRTHPW